MKKTLYLGGPILTMAPSCPKAEALLVEDGAICGVGSIDELKGQAENALVVDLEGQTLMPAFVDGHGHMAQAGLFMQECSLMGCNSYSDILERIRRFRSMRGLTHGEVIRCVGYDPAILKEGKHPDGRLLDSLGFDNPIACLHISKHMGAYNTPAMKLCGIDNDYACSTLGGLVGRDEEGALTGYFEERAMDPFFAVLEKASDEEFERAVLDAQEYYFSHGITTIQDGTRCTKEQLACYERLAEAGRLKADVVVYLDSDPRDVNYWAEALARHGNREYRNHLKIGGIKLILDGSPQGCTAWMREPYEGDTDYCAYPLLPDEKVRRILSGAVRAGLQPLAHCNGDAAAEQYVSCWEEVLKEEGHGAELRPVMIHAQLVGYDHLARMGALGMMPSFFVGHCYFWGDTHMKNFGSRGSRISPVAKAIDEGLMYSFHQDTPVTPPDMLHTVWCAVNRLTRSGACVGPENRIGVYDALAGVTTGAAYGYFEEGRKGVLRTGAVADLVVLSQDPTAVDPMKIRDIRVMRTIRQGETVYTAE